MRRIRRRLGLTLGLASVVLLTAACTSPQPKVTTRPVPTRTVATAAAFHEFVSKRYGFRLTLPKDWKGVDARISWDGGLLLGADSPEFADFTDSTGDRLFTVGAAQLTRGTTLAAWRAMIIRNAKGSCIDDQATKRTMLAAEHALSWKVTCSDGDLAKLAVVHGTRGYVAIFVPLGPRMDAANLAVFDPILRSFRFTD